jgi:hypothetical protein
MIPKQPESRGARQDIQEARRDDAYRDTDRPVRVITANQLGIPRARNLGADRPAVSTCSSSALHGLPNLDRSVHRRARPA